MSDASTAQVSTPPGCVDIGANLTHDSFDHDRAAVLQRARDAGVGVIVVTGSCRSSTAGAIELARTHPGYCYATAGLHPHHARDMDDALADFLRISAAAPDVVAVGETGLDFYRDLSPRTVQERAFIRQLEIAVDIGKPVFLHERDAYPRFAEILRVFRPRLTGAVVHCFTGSREALNTYLELDCYIGITGWICDERRGALLRELAREVPADRLLVETDAPYLLPHVLKAKSKSRRNEPAFLREVLNTLAQVRSEPATDLAARTAANSRRFFQLPS